MILKDMKRFAVCMASLGESVDKIAGKLKVEVYFRALSDFNIEQIEKAAWEIIETRKYSSFPQVAEIREAIVGNLEDKAILALHELEQAVAKHGFYSTVIFSDKVIHLCVEALGGWETVCNMPQEEWKWSRKEFLKLYQAFTRALQEGKQIKIPERLVGFIEQQNEFNGYRDKIPQPVYIAGDGDVTALPNRQGKLKKHGSVSKIADVKDTGTVEIGKLISAVSTRTL